MGSERVVYKVNKARKVSCVNILDSIRGFEVDSDMSLDLPERRNSAPKLGILPL